MLYSKIVRSFSLPLLLLHRHVAHSSQKMALLFLTTTALLLLSVGASKEPPVVVTVVVLLITALDVVVLDLFTTSVRVCRHMASNSAWLQFRRMMMKLRSCESSAFGLIVD